MSGPHTKRNLPNCFLGLMRKVDSAGEGGGAGNDVGDAGNMVR